MWKSKALLSGLTLGLLGMTIGGTVSLSTTAEAATWHRGMPKTLRGRWVARKSPFVGIKLATRISANRFEIDNIDPTINANLSYHHKKGSSIYYVRGHEQMYSHGKQVNYYKIKVTKAGAHQRRLRFGIYYQTLGKRAWSTKPFKYLSSYYR